MSTLVIRKKSLKTWEHFYDDRPVYVTNVFNINNGGNETFNIVEYRGAKLDSVPIANVTVYDDTGAGTPETFSTFSQLNTRLGILQYPPFRTGGSGGGVLTIQQGDGIEVDATDSENPIVSIRVSTDVGNNITIGTDGGIYSTGGGGSFDPATDLVGTITPVDAWIETGQTVEEGFSNAQGQIDGIVTAIGLIDLPTVLGVGNSATDLDIVLESTGSGTVLTINPNETTFLDTSGIRTSLSTSQLEIRNTLGFEVAGLTMLDLNFRNTLGGDTNILPHEGENNTNYQHPDKPTGTEIYRMLSDTQSEQLRKNGIDYFNDFIGVSPSDTGQSVNDTTLGFIQSGAGAFSRPLRLAETFSAVSNSNSGVLQQSMGTTSTGTALLFIGNNNSGSIVSGAGVIKSDALVCMSALSDGTNRYTYKNGLFSVWSANPAASIAFVYDEGGVEGIVNNTASPNWRVVTIDASTRTITNTGVAVSATAFQKLSFVVNAGGTSVEFFINDVSVATHTTNIPTGWTKKLLYGSGAVKHLGTTERIAYLDYISINQKLTTPRT